MKKGQTVNTRRALEALYPDLLVARRVVACGRVLAERIDRGIKIKKWPRLMIEIIVMIDAFGRNSA